MNETPRVFQARTPNHAPVCLAGSSVRAGIYVAELVDMSSLEGLLQVLIGFASWLYGLVCVPRPLQGFGKPGFCRGVSERVHAISMASTSVSQAPMPAEPIALISALNPEEAPLELQDGEKEAPHNGQTEPSRNRAEPNTLAHPHRPLMEPFEKPKLNHRQRDRL